MELFIVLQKLNQSFNLYNAKNMQTCMGKCRNCLQGKTNRRVVAQKSTPPSTRLSPVWPLHGYRDYNIESRVWWRGLVFFLWHHDDIVRCSTRCPVTASAMWCMHQLKVECLAVSGDSQVTWRAQVAASATSPAQLVTHTGYAAKGSYSPLTNYSLSETIRSCVD